MIYICYLLCPLSERSEWQRYCFRSMCVCLCVSVRSGPVNQTSLKRLKLRTSNLTRMFPGTVRTWPLKNYYFVKKSLGGDMQSHDSRVHSRFFLLRIWRSEYVDYILLQFVICRVEMWGHYHKVDCVWKQRWHIRRRAERYSTLCTRVSRCLCTWLPL